MYIVDGIPPTTLLQIFLKLILNTKIIVRCIIDSDDIS